LSIVLKNEGGFDLWFGENLRIDRCKDRKLSEMKGVLLDKSKLKGEATIYKMYDGVYKEEDREFIKRRKLRYDLTLIFPGKIGREFIKTAGHYHSISDDRQFTYPELYEVLWGEVHFILQRRGKNENEVEDVVVVTARESERIVIPPEYGHVAINPSVKPLILANWIAEDCIPDYKAIYDFGGASLFEIEEDGERRFLENKNYRHLHRYRTLEVSDKSSSIFKLNNDLSLYDLLIKKPNTLEWLRSPSKEIGKFWEYIEKRVEY